MPCLKRFYYDLCECININQSNCNRVEDNNRWEEQHRVQFRRKDEEEEVELYLADARGESSDTNLGMCHAHTKARIVPLRVGYEEQR